MTDRCPLPTCISNTHVTGVGTQYACDHTPEERKHLAEMLAATAELTDLTKRMGEASRAGDTARALVLWCEGLKAGLRAVRAAGAAKAAHALAKGAAS